MRDWQSGHDATEGPVSGDVRVNSQTSNASLVAAATPQT